MYSRLPDGGQAAYQSALAEEYGTAVVRSDSGSPLLFPKSRQEVLQ